MLLQKYAKKPKVPRLPGDFCCCDLTGGQTPYEVGFGERGYSEVALALGRFYLFSFTRLQRVDVVEDL